MLRIVTPAPIADLLALYTREGMAKPLDMKAAVLQAARGSSVGFMAGDQLVAAAIFYPLPPEREGETLAELVFVCRPQAGHHMLAIVRYARLTAARLPDHARVRAHCARGLRAGRRFTWLCGLRPAGIHGRWKRYEITAASGGAGHGQVR